VRIGLTLAAGPVHEQPTASSPVLGSVRAAQLVVVSGVFGDWYEIVYGEGRGGHAWIAQDLVSFERSAPKRTPAPQSTPAVSETAAIAASAQPSSTTRAASVAPPAPSAALPGTLVFQQRSGGDIYVIGANGSGLRRVATGLDPALSPDGRQIAYTRWDEPRGLFVIDVDGSNERRLIGENLIKAPTWSPDGQHIAFSQQRGGAEARTIVVPGFGEFTIPADPYWRLGVVDLGSGQRDNLPDDNHSFTPSWGPQGILFADGRGLQRTEPAGAAQRLLTSPNAIRNPRWSPDGRSIVAAMEFHNHWEVVKLAADGTGLQRLTPVVDRVNSVAPAWSPDGRAIAFLTDRRGRWELWVMSADGSAPRPLAPGALATMDFNYDFVAEQVVDWRN
jgi:TolB protein